MREHEVPTHVQAEDRVLLWFTFPQVVAMTAVCALSYGAYRYAPCRTVRAEDRDCGPARTGGTGRGGREDRRSTAAAGGRRPAELQAGSAGSTGDRCASW